MARTSSGSLAKESKKGIGPKSIVSVARKIFLEGGWTQKRVLDIGWSDVSQCQACQLEEGTEKHRLCHCPEWHEVRGRFRSPSESGSKKRERRRKSGCGKEESSRTPSVRGHFSMTKWESEKYKS